MENRWNEHVNGFEYSGPFISASVTRAGAHLAPFKVNLGERIVNPYFVAPWVHEHQDALEPVLAPLRGNFFCLPFGAGGYGLDGRKFPVHGEVAGAEWSFASSAVAGDTSALELELCPSDIGGRVVKRIEIDETARSIFTDIKIEGVSGDFPVGYHPNLRMPVSGRMYLSLGSLERIRVMPRDHLCYRDGEYASLAPGSSALSLDRVPDVFGGLSDCSTFPRPEGFCDIVGVYRSPPPDDIAFSFASYPAEGFAWWSLKRASRYAMTLLWMENRGRHGAPWSGRTAVLGIEDVTSSFADPVATSQGNNPTRAAGYPTTRHFEVGQATRFPYLEGVVPLPPGFTRVARSRVVEGGYTFTSVEGLRVTVSADLSRL